MPDTSGKNDVVHVILHYSDAEPVDISIRQETSPSENTSAKAEVDAPEQSVTDEVPNGGDTDAVVMTQELFQEEVSTEAETVQVSDAVGRVQDTQNIDSGRMTSDTVDGGDTEKAPISEFVELEGVQAVLKAADEAALDVAKRMMEPVEEETEAEPLPKKNTEKLSATRPSGKSFLILPFFRPEQLMKTICRKLLGTVILHLNRQRMRRRELCLSYLS